MLKKLLSNPASKWICLGWAGFTLENLILSENRTEIIEYFDNATYHRVYNTLSTLACASVAFGYLRYRPGVKYLKNISNLRLAAGFTIASVGACGVTQLAPKFQVPYSLETGKARCPFDFHDKELGETGGLIRVTRHPMLYSIGLLGFGIGLTSVNLGTMCLLSGPLFVALVGTHHQDYRYRRNIGGTLSPEKESVTSNIPFLALVTGRNDWYELFNELKKLNCLVGITSVGLLMLSRGRRSGRSTGAATNAIKNL